MRMRQMNTSTSRVVALSSLLALLGIVVMTEASVAQRSIGEPPPAERRGPEVAPAQREFGDFSVAFRNLARHALPSIVSIDAISHPTRRCEGPLARRVVGSGFVIAPSGQVLTTSELVFGAERVVVRTHDGSEFVASSVRADPRTNTAVIEISPLAPLPALPLGDSDAMQVGDWVLALGRSSRLTPLAHAGILNGIVPGPGAARGEDFLLTDAALNVGGGPILNLAGEVVGITSTVSEWNENLDRRGVAAPSNLVRWSSRQLIDHGIVHRGYLGVHTQPLNRELARQFNIPRGEGALISGVHPDSPAADAMLQPGDVITRLDGRPIMDARHLTSVVEHLDAGKTYPLQIIRNGESSDVQITVGKLPDHLQLTPRVPRTDAAGAAQIRAGSYADLGLAVHEATPEAVRQSGYRDPVRGVLIDSVQPGSPAAAAGLQKGMVIERVGRTPVSSAADFSATETGLAAGNGVLLYIHTPRGPRFVVIGGDDF